MVTVSRLVDRLQSAIPKKICSGVVLFSGGSLATKRGRLGLGETVNQTTKSSFSWRILISVTNASTMWLTLYSGQFKLLTLCPMRLSVVCPIYNTWGLMGVTLCPMRLSVVCPIYNTWGLMGVREEFTYPDPISGHKPVSIPLASYPGHSQILSRSCGEKSGEGLGSKLRHGPEMVDSVST